MTEQELRVKFEEWLSNFNNLDFNDDKFSILAWIGFQACYAIMQDTNLEVLELFKRATGYTVEEYKMMLQEIKNGNISSDL